MPALNIYNFSISSEHHWLALYNLASIKLKGTIPVKIVLIKTSIYPCIRACFNWFFLFELKNIIEVIWITGCFASIHQHNPDNTCCCQGNMITVFVCFSTINYFNALMLVFTEKHKIVCRSRQYCKKVVYNRNIQHMDSEWRLIPMQINLILAIYYRDNKASMLLRHMLHNICRLSP